jgi:hypothetical protein
MYLAISLLQPPQNFFSGESIAVRTDFKCLLKQDAIGYFGRN